MEVCFAPLTNATKGDPKIALRRSPPRVKHQPQMLPPATNAQPNRAFRTSYASRLRRNMRPTSPAPIPVNAKDDGSGTVDVPTTLTLSMKSP